MAKLRSISIHEAAKAPVEELKFMELIGRGVWSDEVETLARGFAFIARLVTKQDVKWEIFLPERYIHSATMPNEYSEADMTAARRRVSKQLDGIVKKLKNSPNVKQPK